MGEKIEEVMLIIIMEGVQIYMLGIKRSMRRYKL